MSVRISPVALVLALAALPGCDRKTGVSSYRPDTAGVRVVVDSLMRNHFSAFQRGDIDTWSDIFGDSVFFTAADPANVFTGRDSVRARMQEDLGKVTQSGITLAIQPSSSRIWVTDDGRTAGATYELDYSATYQNQTFPYRLRSSYLLERDTTTGWKVLAAQYSRPVRYDTLFMALVQHQVSGSAAVGGETPPSAAAVVQRFRADMRDISQAEFTPTVIVVTPGSVASGPDQARRALAEWLGPAGNATEQGTGVRGGLTQAGSVGWVATNLNVPVFAGPESATAPIRAFFVYRLEAGRWKLAQASLSVGMRER
jgi:ketosteroid isomerase-like protein